MLPYPHPRENFIFRGSQHNLLFLKINSYYEEFLGSLFLPCFCLEDMSSESTLKIIFLLKNILIFPFIHLCYFHNQKVQVEEVHPPKIILVMLRKACIKMENQILKEMVKSRHIYGREGDEKGTKEEKSLRIIKQSTLSPGQKCTLLKICL